MNTKRSNKGMVGAFLAGVVVATAVPWMSEAWAARGARIQEGDLLVRVAVDSAEKYASIKFYQPWRIMHVERRLPSLYVFHLDKQ